MINYTFVTWMHKTLAQLCIIQTYIVKHVQNWLDTIHNINKIYRSKASVNLVY